MVKRPQYLKPITDPVVIQNIEKAFSDTSKRDKALENYKKEKNNMDEDIFDPDYMDIETLIVDAMDYEICEHSSIGQIKI